MPEKAAAALIMEDGSAKADEGRTCAACRGGRGRSAGGGGGAAPHLREGVKFNEYQFYCHRK